MISERGKKILVTGASGLLGGNILYNFPESWSLTGLINKHSLKIKRNIKIINFDLLGNIDDFIKQQGSFDVILHTAALTNVDLCEKEKDLTYKMHVEVTKKIAEWAKNINAHFVHISTDHIFDGKDGNYFETSTPDPLNYYAETKLEAERVIQEINGKYSIIRTNFFGYNVQNKNDLAGWIVNSLQEGLSIRLFRDVFFSPILVNYLVNFLIEIIEEGKEGIFNIAAEDSCSKYDFGMKLAEEFNLNKSLISAISVDDAGLQVKRPKNMSINISKVKKTFKNSIPTIDESIAKYKELGKINYYKKYKFN